MSDEIKWSPELQAALDSVKEIVKTSLKSQLFNPNYGIETSLFTELKEEVRSHMEKWVKEIEGQDGPMQVHLGRSMVVYRTHSGNPIELVEEWKDATMCGEDKDGPNFFLFVDTDCVEEAAHQFAKLEDVKVVWFYKDVYPVGYDAAQETGDGEGNIMSMTVKFDAANGIYRVMTYDPNKENQEENKG